MNRRSLAVALAGAAVAGKGLATTVAARVSAANNHFHAQYGEDLKKLKNKGIDCDDATWEHSHQDTKFIAKGKCKNVKTTMKDKHARDVKLIGILKVDGTEEKRCEETKRIVANGEYHEWTCEVTYNA